MSSGQPATASARVVAVHRDPERGITKLRRDEIVLEAGLGVRGDFHHGRSLQHRSRAARTASQPNLRQVHLMHAELFAELAGRGFRVAPGELGENITTRGVDLLALPTGTRLRLGEEAVVELTGLRNPCRQIDELQRGLMSAVRDRAQDGSLVRKVGVMAVVVAGGRVRAGDRVTVQLPAEPHLALVPV